MSTDTISKTRFQELVNPPATEANPHDVEFSADADYMWRGQRFRLVPMRQAPLLQFRLALSHQESTQIKYACITHHTMNRKNADNRNEIVLVIRDSMRITLAGFNLQELDDALLIQRVLEIESVPMMQAEAALKRQSEIPVITEVRLEYGRFDVENRQWLPGNGH